MVNYNDAIVYNLTIRGLSISAIARARSLPITTVENIFNRLERRGLIVSNREQRRVRAEPTHSPLAGLFENMIKLRNNASSNPELVVSTALESMQIPHAFVGTTRRKYRNQEIRNELQIVVPPQFLETARDRISDILAGYGLQVTSRPADTIGRANDVILCQVFGANRIQTEDVMINDQHIPIATTALENELRQTYAELQV
jgi:hypothetical protein